MATRAQRNHLVFLMEELWKHRGQFVYEQRRPMELIHLTQLQLFKKLAAGEEIIADCSETLTAMCKWAGLRDPNGLGYNGFGNTETMLGHLPHYTQARYANVGAIVHFENPEHVAMVKVPSRIMGNPTLFEHGGPGVAILPLSVERQFHRGDVVFLSINKL